MKKNDGFSVPLGLVDYINPILYAITTYTIIINMKGVMRTPFYELFIIGICISLLFGLIIPTGKLIVGLGIIKFRMPVILVFLVNSGILLSGLILFQTITHIKLALFLVIILLSLLILFIIYLKNKKTNTIAVLIGAIGYLLIYTSLILKSIISNNFIPIAFYIVAISLFIILCIIGIKANLKDYKVHWIIEISNIICQLSVAIGTLLLF